MPKSIHTPEPAEPAGTRYASFILRCWQDGAPPSAGAPSGGEARLRARLVDVNSGVSYPVADLSDLPAVLRRLLRSVFGPAESSDIHSVSKKENVE